MKTEKISLEVVQAVDLTPFTLEGKRVMHTHFFEWSNEGWLMKWVDETTDGDWLKAKITEGVIYVFPDRK